jgi:MFS transporter, AAHS family, 4-hydroxybenzoate transporter
MADQPECRKDANFEIGVLLDSAPLGRSHWRVVALVGLAIVLDGFDLQALAYAAPALIADWGIDRSALAPLFAASLVGVALGGILIGPRGDAWGRRPALIGSVLLFALATLACTCASSTTELMIMRFVAGIGLGGALPNATALVSETTPLRWRALLTSLTIVGVPLGGVLGGEVAARLLPVFGWQSVFLVGGALPLLLALMLALWLPESARFLLRTGGPGAQRAAAVNALLGNSRFASNDPLWLQETPGRRASIAELFRHGLARDTGGLWLIFLANMFAVYCFMNWMPALLVSVGHEFSAASRLLAMFNLGGVAGALLSAWLMRHHGSRRVLSCAALLAVGILASMTRADLASWSVVLTLSILAGGAINALQIGAYVLAAHVYPTATRATGVGLALGVGRAGAVLSSFAGAVVAADAAGASELFGMVTAALLLVLGGVLLVRRHLPAN